MTATIPDTDPGAVIVRAPGGLSWIVYELGGQRYAAAYTHGLVGVHAGRATWWDPTERRHRLVPDDQLAALAACRPHDWPIHPDQHTLFAEPEDERVAWLRSRILTATQVKNLPPPEPLIDGILTAHTLSVLWGKPGSGKSFVALDWALSVATGTWWCGHRTEAAPVLYVAAEGAGGLGQRIDAWEHHNGVWNTDTLQLLPTSINFLDPGWVTPLAELVADTRPALIVVDTLARVMIGGDENAAKDMGLLIGAAGKLQAAADATVLLVHHDTKDGGTMRGSSALLGAVDTSLEIRADGPAITLRCDKAKDTREFDPIKLWRVETRGSCAITDRPPVGHNTRLPDSAIEMLSALRDVGTDGASTTLWTTATQGVAVRTFHRMQTRLQELGYVTADTRGRNKYWTLTEQGEHALDA